MKKMFLLIALLSGVYSAHAMDQGDTAEPQLPLYTMEDAFGGQPVLRVFSIRSGFLLGKVKKELSKEGMSLYGEGGAFEIVQEEDPEVKALVDRLWDEAWTIGEIVQCDKVADALYERFVPEEERK